MWYLMTLSMPNSGTEPHGKVTASATPLLQDVAHLGRARLHVGAAELRHERGHGGVRGADLQALDVAGRHDLLGLGVEGAGIVHEAQAELHVLHLVRGILAIPGVERLRPALAVGHQEGQLAGADDREAAGLIARIDVGRRRRCRRAPCRSGRRPCPAAGRGTPRSRWCRRTPASRSCPTPPCAFCSGWAGGTQWDSLRSTCLSCAAAGASRAETASRAPNARPVRARAHVPPPVISSVAGGQPPRGLADVARCPAIEPPFRLPFEPHVCELVKEIGRI